jgi:hypothetical protein
MLTREDNYAAQWSKDKEATNPDFPDHTVSRTTGNPFSLMDWIVFAQKYIDEAKECYANFTPDQRAVRIRLLKAASLFVTALQVYGEPTDMEEIAGISSTNYPILRGGLKTFLTMKNDGVYTTESGEKYMLGPNNVLIRVV